jgi:hypothetical protein
VLRPDRLNEGGMFRRCQGDDLATFGFNHFPGIDDFLFGETAL